jgi:hypothetical protein
MARTRTDAEQQIADLEDAGLGGREGQDGEADQDRGQHDGDA